MQKNTILFLCLSLAMTIVQAQNERHKVYTLQAGEKLKAPETGLLVASDVQGNYALLIEYQKDETYQTYIQTPKGKLGPIFPNPIMRTIYDKNKRLSCMAIESREWREPNAYILYPDGQILEGKGVTNFEVSPNGENYLKIVRTLDKNGIVISTKIEEKNKKALNFNGNMFTSINDEGWVAYTEPDEKSMVKEIYFSNGKKFSNVNNPTVFIPLENGGFLLGYEKEGNLAINLNGEIRTFEKKDNFEVSFADNVGAQDNFLVVWRAYTEEGEFYRVETFKGYNSPVYTQVMTASAVYDAQKGNYYWLALEKDNSKELFLCDEKGGKMSFPPAADMYDYYQYISWENGNGYISYKLIGDKDGEVLQVIDFQKGKPRGRVIRGITNAEITSQGDILKNQILEGDSLSYQYQFPNNTKIRLREDLRNLQVSNSGETWWGFNEADGYYLIGDDPYNPIGSVLAMEYDRNTSTLHWLTLETGGTEVYWNSRKIK